MPRKDKSNAILSGNMYSAILSLAIPVVLNSFLQTMYNLTDTYWLGKIGTQSMAAITLVTPVQNIILNVGSGITVAGSVLVSQYIGAKDVKNAKSMANQLFACAMIFATFCGLLCYFLTPSIVGWLGATGTIKEYGIEYLRIIMLDMPFLYMINIYAAITQAQGDTVKPMLLNLIGICINMVLDPLFLVVLDMGIGGAALATLFAKIPSAVVAFILINSKKKDVHLELSKFKFEKEKLLNILRVGFPTAIGGSTMQLGFLLMSKNVYEYGDMAVAAYGIGNKVNGLISLPSNAIGSATAIIVGQNVGAHQYDRARKGYIIARNMAVIFLFCGGMILSREVVSTAIVSIFSDDPEVIRMAADFLSVMAFWCFTNGVQNATSGLFQGNKRTEINMIIDITRLWVFRFLTLYICETVLKMGVRSIWYSVVVSNALSALVLYILYHLIILRKYKKLTGTNQTKDITDKA